MNKFEQISSDGHQMSLVGGDQGWDEGSSDWGVLRSHVWVGGGAGAREEVLRSHVLGVGGACTVRSNVSWVM